jgi:hypothetical protein
MPLSRFRTLGAAASDSPVPAFDVSGLIFIAIGIIVLVVVAIIVLRRRDRGGS